jgi:hypothetical protein
LGLLFNPEDGANMFLQNISLLSSDYTAVYPGRHDPSNSGKIDKEFKNKDKTPAKEDISLRDI